MITAQDLSNHPDIPGLIAGLNSLWKEEQERRHEFWTKVDPSVKAEFIDGQVVSESPVNYGHGFTAGNIHQHLKNYLDQNPIGVVLIEKALIRLTRNDFEPDVVFWRKDKSDDFERTQMVFPAPDFVVEVLSPTSHVRDRKIKFNDYARHGVEEYWIVDPETQMLEQYLLKGNEYELAFNSGQGKVESQVIKGWSMDISLLWM